MSVNEAPAIMGLIMTTVLITGLEEPVHIG